MSTKDVAATRRSRITVTLPSELVRALDERLVNGEGLTGEGNRSAVIRRLIEQELRARDERERREQEEREQVEQFIRAWKEQPETEEEFGWLDHAVRQYAAEEPWE